MTNGRISSWFSYLRLNSHHLTDLENKLVENNYKQWCTSNRMDEYAKIRDLVDKLKNALCMKSTVHQDKGSYKAPEVGSRLQYGVR